MDSKQDIRQNIINTLCYSDIFDFPLTEKEIWRFYNGGKISYSAFKQELRKLSFLKSDKYYTLPLRGEIIGKRKDKEKESYYKLNSLSFIIKVLSCFPSILFIGISGSLSLGNATLDDDIDLFFITKKNTLWMTRLLVNLFLMIIQKKRKKNSAYEKNLICPNMFISEDELRCNSQNLYIAREVAQLKVLVSKGTIYKRFLYENRWIHKYLPNIPINNTIVEQKKNKLRSNLLKLVDFLAYKIQVFYMKYNKTREVVTLKRAEFHPLNTSNIILEQYVKKVLFYNNVELRVENNPKCDSCIPYLASN